MQGYVVDLVKRLRAALKDDSLIAMPSWVEPIQNAVPESESPDGTDTAEKDGSEIARMTASSPNITLDWIPSCCSSVAT